MESRRSLLVPAALLGVLAATPLALGVPASGIDGEAGAGAAAAPQVTAVVPQPAGAVATVLAATGPGLVSQAAVMAGTSQERRLLLAGGSVQVCAMTKAITKAGGVALTCPLTAAARAARAKASLVVALTTTFTGLDGVPVASTITVQLPRTAGMVGTSRRIPVTG